MSVEDFAAAGRRGNAPTGDWRDGLSKTEAGTARKNLFNACVALRDHPKVAGKLAYNEFAGCTWARGTLPWDGRSNRAWSPVDDLAATEWLQGPAAIQVGSGIAREAVERVAYEDRFHPVLEWLESLAWDGEERLAGWLTTYLGVLATPLVSAIGRKFLISAVARVMRPGCKADQLLILEGPQGILKSTALRTLVGDEWVTDQIADLGTKDSSQDLRGVWVVELSELSAIRPSEVEKVKAYVSRQIDHYRPSYGRRTIDVPRQTVFVGTTNSSEYLTDSTGGRRFWPVICTSIDVEALARDRAQLWAEAVAAYHAGESWWIDDAELREAAQAEQEERRISDPWESVVADWLDDPKEAPDRDGIRRPIDLENGRVKNSQVLEHAICKPIERQSTADQMRIGRILKRLGWQKRRCGKTRYVEWEPGGIPHVEPDDAIEAENARQGIPLGEVSRQGIPPETHGNSHAQAGGIPRDTYSAHTRDPGGSSLGKHERGVSGVPPAPDDDETLGPVWEEPELPDDDEHAAWLRGA